MSIIGPTTRKLPDALHAVIAKNRIAFALRVGGDDKAISTVDAQGWRWRLQTQSTRVTALEKQAAEIAVLTRQMADLHAAVLAAGQREASRLVLSR